MIYEDIYYEMVSLRRQFALDLNWMLHDSVYKGNKKRYGTFSATD